MISFYSCTTGCQISLQPDEIREIQSVHDHYGGKCKLRLADGRWISCSETAEWVKEWIKRLRS